jgi:hypothetical protein
MSHSNGPGHTRCGWADAARFTEGPEWPRNQDGSLRTLRALDFRIGHTGPLVLFNLGGARRLQADCRVCGWVLSVDVDGRPVRDILGDPLCSSPTCLRRFMGYLMDTSGPTTEEIVTGRA